MQPRALARLPVASLLAFLAVAAAPSVARAQLLHGAAIQKTPVGPSGLSKAHVGDTITARIRVTNLDDFEDTLTITNIVDVVHHASGDETSPNLLAAPVTLAYTERVTVTNTYVVLPGDPDPLLDDAQAGGIDNHDGIGGSHVPQDFFVSFPGQIHIVRPCIQVFKSCANGVGESGLITWSGAVSNCGNGVLTNVVVSNLVNGVMTLVFGPVTLETNQSATFTGSYTGGCVPTTDTLLASGVDELALRVTSSASATCSNIITAGIAVTKNCPASAVAPGAVLVFSGVVSNTGNVTLTNVVVVDNQPTANTPVFGPVTLAPGQSLPYSGSYTTAVDTCGPWNDTVTATARSTCGVAVTNTASASCPAITTSGIAVAKVCPESPVSPGGVLTYTGFITNTGNISLTNVVVVNDQPAPNTVVFGPTNLAPGQVLSFSRSYTVPANGCGPWVDTLTATARSVCGTNVTNSATAICPATTTAAIRVTKNCPANAVAPGELLTFTGSVSNAGNISLTNVIVVNDQPTPNTVVFGPTNLTPGAVLLFTNSYQVPNNFCGPANDTLTATATSLCGSNVSHQAFASCPVVTLPAVRVTKNCPPTPVAPGDLLTFTGSVSNAGNISLTNVIVVNDQPSPNTVVFGPTNLAPGAVLLFTNTYRVPTDFCGPANDTLTATATSVCGSNVSHQAFASCPVVTTSIIRVAKFCPSTNVPPGGLLVFSGAVSNVGNITLTNVVVVNDKPSPNTVVFGPTNLAPGQFLLFTNSYVLPADSCATATDTLTATAKSVCGTNVSHQASASCPITTTAGIRVTKDCLGPVAPGDVLIFTGSVSNTGNITLTNVIVVNNKPEAGTLVFGPTNLAPGAVLLFTNSYRVPLDFCGPAVDTLTATATTTCGTSVTNSATASCDIITKPILRLTKNCPPNPVAPGELLVFTGSLSNAGNISITNIVVVNSQPTPGTPVFGPTNLSPGQIVFFTNSYRVPLDACGPWVDTLTATGTSICGTFAIDSTSATCPAVTTPLIRVGKFCPESPVAPGGVLTYSGVVSNIGNISLTNVVVRNDAQGNAVVFGPTNLAPGAVLFFSGSYTVPADACGPWIDTLSASATSICGATVSHTATATCPTIVTPGIVVTKSCPATNTPPGGLLVFTGSVSNSGNISLTNVVVRNSAQANAVVFGPTNLTPGQILRFTNQYTVPLDGCGPWIDTLTATAATVCGTNITNSATASCPALITSGINVRKFCPATNVPPGSLLIFSGTVSNTGNVTLTNVTVVNNQPAPNTPVLGPMNLAPGQSISFTNSYTTPLDQCGPWVDTLTARGVTICGTLVTNTAVAICPAVTTPAIRVTKNCPATPTAPGDLLVFSGTVSNAGNITLVNVTVVDNQPAPNTPVLGPITLAPGEVRTFTASYRTPIDSCGPYIDTVTARGTSICGVAVTNTATATCPSLTTPRITITKSCPTNPTPFGGLLVYSGVVSNSGNVRLTNVFVFDNKPTNNTPVLGPTNLLPGQSIRFTNSYIVADDDCCGPYADMVTAVGASACTGSNVMKTATAVCPGITYPSLTITRTCPTGPIVLGQPIVFSGIVSNSGNVVLSNVLVIGQNGEIIMSMQGFSIGEWMDYTGSFIISNCPPSGLVTNTVTITGNDICTGARVSSTATCIINCGGGAQPVTILSPMLLRTKFTLSFQSQQGKSYTVQYIDSLTPPITGWQTLSNVIGTGGILPIEDTSLSTQRFYRVLSNP
jgi:uncharacterized repeat protein (TIGR01451 family)